MEHRQPDQEDQEQWLSFLGYFQEPSYAEPNEFQTVQDWMFYFEPALGCPGMGLDWNIVDACSARPLLLQILRPFANNAQA